MYVNILLDVLHFYITRLSKQHLSNTFTSNIWLKLAKNQALAKQHLEAELLLFKN